MLRRAPSRKSTSKIDDIDQKSKRSSSHRRNNGTRGSSWSFIPKPLIGTLLIFGCGAILLLISRFTSRGKRADGNATGNENLRKIVVPEPEPEVVIPAAATITTPLDPVGITSAATNATLHIIFSTDCGAFQHWQTYLFFHAALKVQQPGYVTRIASGCSDKELIEEKEWHETHISGRMSDRFRIHFTPHFSGVKDPVTGEVQGDYKFFNKPFGLKHFLEYNELLGFDESGKEMKHPDDVIILTDPDFLLLRPLTDDFSNERETIVAHRRKPMYQNKESHFVTHGNPYAQTYGLGAQWRTFDLDAIAGPDSPAKDVDQAEALMAYPAGPPYIGTAKDMYKIAVPWSDFAPKVHKQYPHLLAEMFAYCIAAAHLRLPHMLIDSLMVSAVGIGGEGWKFVKDIPSSEMCTFAASPDHTVHPVPSVIHYCQRYAVDKYFFGKRKVPHEVFTCEHPMLMEPPADLGSGKYLSVVPNGQPDSQRKEMTAEKEKMEAFMVCALTKATNEAMASFKTNHCEGGGNTKKTYDMWAGKNVA